MKSLARASRPGGVDEPVDLGLVDVELDGVPDRILLDQEVEVVGRARWVDPALLHVDLDIGADVDDDRWVDDVDRLVVELQLFVAIETEEGQATAAVDRALELVVVRAGLGAARRDDDVGGVAGPIDQLDRRAVRAGAVRLVERDRPVHRRVADADRPVRTETPVDRPVVSGVQLDRSVGEQGERGHRRGRGLSFDGGQSGLAGAVGRALAVDLPGVGVDQHHVVGHLDRRGRQRSGEVGRRPLIDAGQRFGHPELGPGRGRGPVGVGRRVAEAGHALADHDDADHGREQHEQGGHGHRSPLAARFGVDGAIGHGHGSGGGVRRIRGASITAEVRAAAPSRIVASAISTRTVHCPIAPGPSVSGSITAPVSSW